MRSTPHTSQSDCFITPTYEGTADKRKLRQNISNVIEHKLLSVDINEVQTHLAVIETYVGGRRSGTKKQTLKSWTRMN